MQKSPQEELEELLAGRIIELVEADEIVGVKRAEKSNVSQKRGESKMESEPESSTTVDEEITTELNTSPVAIAPDTSVHPTFTKIEKSLASLGFFTPSSRRLKDQKVKRMSFTRDVAGKRVEVTATIIPSALFGLPITADQDKYLALQEIITDVLNADGKVTNPIRFKSADLLRLMNRSTKTGKNFKEINEWLDVMMSTTIFSEGTVYKSGQKQYAKDRFRVFDRAVSVGKELDDGSIADANYVWLSEWQLENINNKFLLPIDLETYRELKNHITKALVPLLQIWLFASHKKGVFEKRYDELCEILSLQTYRTPSQILRQLKPSLDELTQYEYLEKWRIEKTSDRKAYKILFFHGSKFHRDSRKRLDQKNQSKPPIIIAESDPIEIDLPEPGKLEALPVPARTTELASVPEPKAIRTKQPEARTSATAPVEIHSESAPAPEKSDVLDELVVRGLMASVAIKLLTALSPDRLETVQDYIDYWDSIARDKRGPGLLHSLIQNNDPLPPSFETTRKRAQRLASDDRRRNLVMVKQYLTTHYEEHCRNVIDRFIAEELTTEEFERRVEATKKTAAQQTDLWQGRMSPALSDGLARGAVRSEISKEIPMISFADFQKRELPRILAELHLDSTNLGIELGPNPSANQPNIA